MRGLIHKIKMALWFVLIFMLGWTFSSLYAIAGEFSVPADSRDISINVDAPDTGSSLHNIQDILSPTDLREEKKSTGTDLYGVQDIPSPHDWIKEDEILVFDDKIEINIKNAVWATFLDTNSMDPVIDYGANAIEIVPTSSSDIHLGDIVSYASSIVDGTVIHRVVKIGNDEEGWYVIMKGDNISYEDPEKVRFSQIRRIVVAIIY